MLDGNRMPKTRPDDTVGSGPTSLHLSGTLRLKVGICIEVGPRTHQSGSFEPGVLSLPSGQSSRQLRSLVGCEPDQHKLRSRIACRTAPYRLTQVPIYVGTYGNVTRLHDHSR